MLPNLISLARVNNIPQILYQGEDFSNGLRRESLHTFPPAQDEQNLTGVNEDKDEKTAQMEAVEVGGAEDKSLKNKTSIEEQILKSNLTQEIEDINKKPTVRDGSPKTR